MLTPEAFKGFIGRILDINKGLWSILLSHGHFITKEVLIWLLDYIRSNPEHFNEILNSMVSKVRPFDSIILTNNVDNITALEKRVNILLRG